MPLNKKYANLKFFGYDYEWLIVKVCQPDKGYHFLVVFF